MARDPGHVARDTAAMTPAAAALPAIRAASPPMLAAASSRALGLIVGLMLFEVASTCFAVAAAKRGSRSPTRRLEAG